MNKTDFHHVCETQPACLCAGDGSEDCDCFAADRDARETICLACGEPLFAIHMETGERLPPGALSSYAAPGAT